MGERDLWENGVSLVMSKPITVKSLGDKFIQCLQIDLLKKKTGIGFVCELGYQKN